MKPDFSFEISLKDKKEIERIFDQQRITLEFVDKGNFQKVYIFTNNTLLLMEAMYYVGANQISIENLS